LLSTIGRQIWRQAHAPTVEGVSKWLFTGQMAASVLYLVYSILVKNPVFVASNAALLIAGIAGQVIYLRRRREQAKRASAEMTTPGEEASSQFDESAVPSVCKTCENSDGQADRR